MFLSLHNNRGATWLSTIVGLTAILLIVQLIYSSKPTYQVNKGNMQTVTKLSNISAALNRFKSDIGRYPTTEEGLAVLVIRPSHPLPYWTGPYLDYSDLTDAWGNQFYYSDIASSNQQPYDLISLGQDGKAGTRDDLSRWSNSPIARIQ